MKVKIEFDTDNAAFQEDCGGDFESEVILVLDKAKQVVSTLRVDVLGGAASAAAGLRDTNGNQVGIVVVTP